MKLAELTCQPIKAGTAPLSNGELQDLLREMSEWTLRENSIVREFRFKDFRQAMDFVNKVADIANAQDHHPDIFVSYNMVRITLSTHKIGGLSPNDFIVAAKIDVQAEQRTA